MGPVLVRKKGEKRFWRENKKVMSICKGKKAKVLGAKRRGKSER